MRKRCRTRGKRSCTETLRNYLALLILKHSRAYFVRNNVRVINEQRRKCHERPRAFRYRLRILTNNDLTIVRQRPVLRSEGSSQRLIKRNHSFTYRIFILQFLSVEQKLLSDCLFVIAEFVSHYYPVARVTKYSISISVILF